MRRREFILALGGAAAPPVVPRAQQPAKQPIIGLLGASTALAWGDWVAAFGSISGASRIAPHEEHRGASPRALAPRLRPVFVT
jgi:hypothetical protein